MPRFPCIMPLNLAGVAFAGLLTNGASAIAADALWPAGQSPQEIGRRVASRFVADLTHSNWGMPGPRPTAVTYPEICVWYGALTFAQATGDAELKAALARRFEPLLGPTTWPGHPAANNLNTVDERHLVPAPDHVDWVVFAAVPLELYLQTKEERYRKVGLVMTDWQWAYPDYGFPFEHPVLQRYFPDRITPEALDWYARGYTWQTRLWIDDMYMISAAQTQAYRATGDHKYIDRAAKEMVLYLERLQRPNGLFYHHPDTPYYWGRGNGWMAAGCAELLRALPEDNPDRPAIMAGYRKMMAALLHYQDADGMWHQLVDDPAAWPETSGTGMFTFAFITGVNHGWLDEATYGSAARRAWLALADYINADGDVGQVCRGTNIYNPRDPEHGPDGRAYYLACRRNTGDLHGQAPVLWCATAWMRDGK